MISVEKPPFLLLDLQDLDEPGSTTIEISHGGSQFNIMIIRQAGEIAAYLNSCPHLGTPLDWNPGDVLDRDKRYITCATHGALFLIHNGYCISGPCAGARLKKIPLTVRDGRVFLDCAEL